MKAHKHACFHVNFTLSAYFYPHYIIMVKDLLFYIIIYCPTTKRQLAVSLVTCMCKVSPDRQTDCLSVAQFWKQYIPARLVHIMLKN